VPVTTGQDVINALKDRDMAAIEGEMGLFQASDIGPITHRRFMLSKDFVMATNGLDMLFEYDQVTFLTSREWLRLCQVRTSERAFNPISRRK
jgi:hypothetical protein